MTDAITSIADLEACIGATPTPVKMKIIDHLDDAAAAWIADAPLAFVGLGAADGPRVGLAGGAKGFAERTGPTTLAVPLASLDIAAVPEVGMGAGVLFLIPGIGETLRANGRVAAVRNGRVDIAIEECFVHCAKALIRSDFWTAAAGTAAGDAKAFLATTRFLALATMDASGRIDISPKGDPADLLIRWSSDDAVLAERPGNRLAFGYRNILEEPRVAALCVAPGSTTVLELRGRAGMTRDETLRASFVVDGKTPLLATVIHDVSSDLRPSPALERATPWRNAHAASTVDPAATLVAHLKLNKTRGVQAVLMRLAVNRGLVAKGLAANYKAELY
jgi:predicted pyridoxine 5'-phosphate oxidase superfamily flavin-nucleotide-binding protein